MFPNYYATTALPINSNRSIGTNWVEKKAQETVEAMGAGPPLIAQGVLRDPGSQTYGAPDFLIRSDVLNKLFPGTPKEASVSPARWHCQRVDFLGFMLFDTPGC